MSGDRPSVRVHVASANTRRVTELCIRSMRRFAGYPFELMVGECGSVDGSIEMLSRFEKAGWLTLDVSNGWPLHHDWIDKWFRSCPTRYAVFCDSDVEFRGDGWLAELVEKAQRNSAALVTAEFGPEEKDYIHPVSGRRMRVAPRPAMWILLLDMDQVRHMDTSFASIIEDRDDLPEGAISYDTGALFFADLAHKEGLKWEVMPRTFFEKAHHFGGLSWKPLSGVGASRRIALYVRARLLAYRTIWRSALS